MLFITVQGVRINVQHVRSYVGRRDGVLFTFDSSELMVAHATLDEVDKAIQKHELTYPRV